MWQLTTDERFARLFPLLEAYETRHAVDHITDREPLISDERAHEIRQFHIALAELQHKYGLKLESFDDGEPLAIIDMRRDLPQGYAFAALVRADGTLEVATWVE